MFLPFIGSMLCFPFLSLIRFLNLFITWILIYTVKFQYHVSILIKKKCWYRNTLFNGLSYYAAFWQLEFVSLSPD